MEAGKKWDLISIASIPLIMTLGNSMLIPILPAIAKNLHINQFEVSMLITVYSAIAILLIPIAGYLSDQFGRKAVIIPSLIIVALGGTVSGLAAWWFTDRSAYWLILAGRFLQGIGAAGAAPIVLPLVGDIFHNNRDVSRGLGLVETSNTAGKVLSPIVGSLLAMVVWFLPFLAIPVFCLISLLLVIFLVKTPKEVEKKVSFHSFYRSIRQIFKIKGRWLYAIFVIGCICMFVIFGLLFYLSAQLEEQYNIQGVTKGFILAIPLAALCTTSYFTGKIIGQHKIRMKWITFSGMTLLTCAIFFIGWFEHIYYIIGALFIGGIGIGSVLPCLDALITEGIEEEHRGTITSIYSSMRFVGVSLGPPIISILLKTNHKTLFFTIAGVCIIGAIMTLMSIKPKQDLAPEKGGDLL
jgi:ACDE family multidrug resistance protein